jgi:hypothetical protein
MFDWNRRGKDRGAGVDADVAVLMDSSSDPCYAARARERTATDEVEAKHWSSVALAIVKRTGKAVGLDTATRKADADDHEVRMTVTGGRQRVYRLRYIAPGSDGLRVAEAREILAPDAGTAMDAMGFEEWPPKATYGCLVELDGKVITEEMPQD